MPTGEDSFVKARKAFAMERKMIDRISSKLKPSAHQKKPLRKRKGEPQRKLTQYMYRTICIDNL